MALEEDTYVVDGLSSSSDVPFSEATMNDYPIASSPDPTLTFLECAKDFDTVALAKGTERALQIIMPWCHLREPSRSSVAKDIQEQAVAYARAINSSVEAAHLGFAMAEDALTLIEMLPSTSMEERREYFEGLKDIAQKGYSLAVASKKAFHNVRSTVEILLTRMKKEQSNESVEHHEIFNGFVKLVRRPWSEAQSELSKGIHDLEEFGLILSSFAAWWNEIALKTNSQRTRSESAGKRAELDGLRLKIIENRWNDLKRRYAAYVNEITAVQDRYPALFDEAADSTPPTGSQRPFVSEPECRKEGSPPPANYQPNPPPTYTASPPPRPVPTRSGSKVIISEDLSRNYVSAELSNVQILEEKKCLLVLRLQCHPSLSRRFTSLHIKWRFKAPWKGGKEQTPIVVDVSPKQSIGAKMEEVRHRKFGMTIPAQFNLAGANFGPQFEHRWGAEKTIHRATVIMGSIRGYHKDSAEWSVEENTSALSGIPPHFCVAAVVEYEDVFMMELDIVSKQSGIGHWFSSRSHSKSGWLPVDANKLQRELPEYKPAETWRKWFPMISGEVEGGFVELQQDAIRRAG